MNKEMKDRLVMDRFVMLQAFVEYYLITNKGKTFEQLYPDIEDRYGILNPKQEELLHDFLADVYKSFGLDLNKVLEEKNAKVTPGNVLTDFEMKELLRMADQQIVLTGTIVRRKERLLPKNNK